MPEAPFVSAEAREREYYARFGARLPREIAARADQLEVRLR